MLYCRNYYLSRRVSCLTFAFNSEVTHVQPLAASLRTPLASITRGNPHSAINRLKAFQHQIRGQVLAADPTLSAWLIQSSKKPSIPLKSMAVIPEGRNRSDPRNALSQRVRFAGAPFWLQFPLLPRPIVADMPLQLQKQVLFTSSECWQKNDLLQHLPQLSPGTPFPQNSPDGTQD